MTRRWTSLALLLVLTACAHPPGKRDLARTDLEGAKACAMLASWLRDPGSMHRFDLAMKIATPAGAASTKEIRDTANGVADFPRPEGGFDGKRLVDLAKLHQVCSEHGVDMPPYHE